MRPQSEVEHRLAEAGATRLWLTYHDYGGVARSKAVGPDRLPDAAERGVSWAKANWDFAITDHQVPEPGFAADSGDVRLVPDASTIRPLPHRPGVAVGYGWLYEPDGSPWSGDPRACLAAAERALRDAGVEAQAAFEAEFSLHRPSGEGAAPPADRGPMFSQAALDQQWDLLDAILGGLEAMGIATHQIAKEYGPGQYELSLLPATPLEAVDRWLAAHDLIKSLARQRELIATFMPKPRDDLAGNGLHLHLSLTDADRRDLLPDPRQAAALSAAGQAVVAGLLEHAAAQAALGCPTPNSYKRLLPGSWAPAHVAWAIGNRSALVRVPAPGEGRRLEYRAGDASANPYLHVAGLLTAMRDGLVRRPEAPAPITLDLGHLSDEEAAAVGAPRLPSRLDVALDALERDELLCGALGPVVAPHYLAVKRFEWQTYLAESGFDADDTRVSAWERSTYLEAV